MLAGNDHINSNIYEMFELIDSRDIETFVNKFKTESNSQRFHTYRELILGAELSGRGLRLRYEKDIDGRTPDWSVIDDAGAVSEILDVVTLHQRRVKDLEIGSAVANGNVWGGWVTVSPDHIYSKIQHKADSYIDLAVRNRLPYTVCVFGEFTACIDPAQIEHVLHTHHGGIFKDHPGCRRDHEQLKHERPH